MADLPDTGVGPFAGIAFLWNATAVRLLIRARTPSPSAIPFGLQALSGGLFVGLLFGGTAMYAITTTTLQRSRP